MSDDLDFEEETPENPNIRQLREQAKRGREAESRAEAAERELAFARAGLDLSDSRMGYFVRGYDGDLTREAIREAAERDGFLNPPKTQEQVPSQEQQALERMGRVTEQTAGEIYTEPSVDQDMRALYDQADRENWSTDKFNEELTHFVQQHGGPVSRDHGEFQYRRI